MTARDAHTRTVLIRSSLPTYAYLIVTAGSRRGAIQQLSTDVTTIGRSADNDLQLDDATMSTRHARVRRDDDGDFTLIDLGTSNGARVNGRQIQQARLRHNDAIRLGETTFVFKRVG